MTKDHPQYYRERYLDSDEYPTDEGLERLSNWSTNDINGAIEFMRELWHYDEWGVRDTFTDEERTVYHLDPDRRYVKLSTGGWSGNEDLMTAFRSNPLRREAILVARRAGHYVLEYVLVKTRKRSAE